MTWDYAWNGLKIIAQEIEGINHQLIGKQGNIVDAIFEIASSIRYLADSIRDTSEIKKDGVEV